MKSKLVLGFLLASSMMSGQVPLSVAFAAGPWLFCHIGIFPAWACKALPAPTGSDSDSINVRLHNDSATEFIFYVTGKDISGSEKSYTGWSARTPDAESTEVNFPGGIAYATAIHIAEISRADGGFVVLEYY